MNATNFGLFAILLVNLFCVPIHAGLTSRILNGNTAKLGQFPHQVLLAIDDEFTCGGSIVSSRYVLTAAHCVVDESGIDPIDSKKISLRVGSIKRESGGQVIGVKKVIIRPSFGNFLDDIALLELNTELIFNESVNKIDLYYGELPNDSKVIVSGWGRLNFDEDFADNLQYVTVNTMDPKECEEAMAMGYDQMMCLKHKVDHGICAGDSGGPAVYEGKLVGVASFNYNGCGTEYPDGYGKVSYHREWILKNML